VRCHDRVGHSGLAIGSAIRPMARRAPWRSNSPMPSAPRLRLEPRPSRRAAIAFTLAGVATAGVVLALPLAWEARLAVVAAAVVVIDARLRALRRSVPALIHLGLDRRIAVTGADGHTHQGTVLPCTYVGARVVSVVWRPDGGSRWRPAPALLLLPDMLTGDEHRQLRVALRYGRVPAEEGRVEAGASASASAAGAVVGAGGAVRVAASGARTISGDVAA
jgi:hypothetical protein